MPNRLPWFTQQIQIQWVDDPCESARRALLSFSFALMSGGKNGLSRVKFGMKERAGETPRGYVHVISDAPDKGCVGEIRPSGGTNLEQKVEFKSGGYTLKGVLTRPEGKSNVPLVVMAGGWCYTKEIVLPNYAKEFVDIGCATLAFDYRNFGESEGDIRQNLNPWEQIEDIRNAVSFAETLEGIDHKRIGLMGISYAGGHAIITGAIEPRLAFVISAVPVIDGYLTLRRCHGEMRFAELLEVVAEDRKKRYEGKPSGKIAQSPKEDPSRELTAWPFPHIYSGFMAIKERSAPLHEHWTTIESVEWLLRYQVKPYAERIYETPVLVAIARGDNITSADLEIEMFNAIPNPNKSFVSVGGVDHMSLYTKPDHLEKIGKASAQWLKDTLAKL